MAHRNRWFTWVYLLKVVIFHGYVSHNQIVNIMQVTAVLLVRPSPFCEDFGFAKPWCAGEFNRGVQIMLPQY